MLKHDSEVQGSPGLPAREFSNFACLAVPFQY
jgi:hypothetical protein